MGFVSRYLLEQKCDTEQLVAEGGGQLSQSLAQIVGLKDSMAEGGEERHGRRLSQSLDQIAGLKDSVTQLASIQSTLTTHVRCTCLGMSMYPRKVLL
jgi:hypothetical protein